MIALLFLGPSAITPGANAAGQNAVPSIAVPEVVGPAPKIDGVLDDPFWQQAVTGDFRLPDGKLPVTKARWLIARQGRTIYLAVECFADAKALASLKADVKEHDSRQIWQDDEVELFIDPSGKRRSYYHVMINCAGTTTDTFRPYFREADIWWNPPYPSAAKVGEKRWVVEMALPLSIFDRTKEFAKEWAVNVFCSRQAAQEFVFWSPVGTDKPDAVVGTAHKPWKFGVLTGLPVGPNPDYKPPMSRVVRVDKPEPGPPREAQAPVRHAENPAPAELGSLTLLDGNAEPPAGMKSEWVTIGPAQVAPGDAGVTVTFPAQADSAAIFHLPRDHAVIYDHPVFSVSSDFCIWAPYKELVIQCVNTSGRELKVSVLIEDLTAYYLGTYRTLGKTPDAWPKIEKYWRGQMASLDVTLKPGPNEVRVPLGRRFRTLDARRKINLYEIWGVGLACPKSDRPVSVRIGKIRLEGGKKGQVGLAALWPADAGPLPPGDKYPIKRYEEMAKLGINDPNATHCPFSGKSLKEKYVAPGEVAGALRIYPRCYATVTPEGAESPYPHTADFEKHVDWFLEGWGLHHYASTMWEVRGFLFYDLNAIPKGARVKAVQLRLPSYCYTGKPEKGKPWWPPMQIYEVADGGGNWDYDELPTWVTQPPTGRLLVQGGLYRWNGEITKLWSYDLTGYARERLKMGKTDVGVSLRVMTSGPAWPDPHPLGHCNSFYGTGTKDRDLCPYLYVELELTKSGTD